MILVRRIKESFCRKVFHFINFIIMIFLVLICIIPMLNAIALSVSDKYYVAAGMVSLYPRGFNLTSYIYLFQREPFWHAFMVSIIRVITGTSLNLVMILLTSYPLSKEHTKLRFRTAYVWFIFITMLIGGGLIPNYLLITRLGLRNTLFALILPGALPVFNVVLMINFFRQIPNELEEASLIDGAGYLATLVRIYIPCSKAAIATISLFCMVNHWNSWFDGLIYVSSSEWRPLQTYLRMVVLQFDMSRVSINDLEILQLLSDRALRSAQIIIAMIPILAVYPFLQKYFIKGIVLGSVKG